MRSRRCADPNRKSRSNKAATQCRDGIAGAVPSPAAVPTRQSWAQEVFGFPDTTGSVPESKPVEKKEGPNTNAVNPPKQGPDGKVGAAGPARRRLSAGRARRTGTACRIAVRSLMRVRARGNQEIREKPAEGNGETDRVARPRKSRTPKARITTTTQKKEEVEANRFKGLVTMYENMKAKDAAKVFDRLEMKVLIEIASQINPRRMADIMAQMSAEAAERLTVEMANRAGTEKGPSSADLPKIEGKPNGS